MVDNFYDRDRRATRGQARVNSLLSRANPQSSGTLMRRGVGGFKPLKEVTLQETRIPETQGLSSPPELPVGNLRESGA
jgi:hypothetical protein